MSIPNNNSPGIALPSPSHWLRHVLAIIPARYVLSTSYRDRIGWKGRLMATLLATNADVMVTMDGERRELRQAGLFARDGVIEQVGPVSELPEAADTVLDLRGHILLPGLINCHHHLDQVLTRNLPAAQNTNLFPWLKAHYRVWASRTPEDTRTAVIVGCAELARSGCTTVFDHAYVFQNGCKVDDQIAAAAEVGVR